MRILVIHQVPYRKISYALGIDHELHDVTYIGFPERMADLPADLLCRRIELTPDEDLVEGIRVRTSRQDGYEKVLSLSEFGILEAWHVRQHLGIAGPSLSRTERVRDKVRMKEALVDSGIRHPRFVATPPSSGLLPWSGRTVLKPRQGASSEGVTIHDTPREAIAAHGELAQQEDFQLEEYIDGDVLHADGLVRDGVLVDLVVSKYLGKPVDFASGAPLGSHQIPYEEHYRHFAVQVISALEIEEGCIHLEFFETSDRELVFLEIANRMGGGGILDSHRRHTGVHLPSHEIAIRLGFERPQVEPSSGRYHAWLVFPGHHLPAGQGHAITVPEQLRDHPCVDELYVLPPTQPLPDEITYQEWLVPVFVEASHEDAGTLRAFLDECTRAISVRSTTAPAPVGTAR
ncbi:acetyl-CoA carboxylase biotin carboxylase subunit family protein [Streptomyces sp. NPDC058623]|uniref:ATP-grasp domain-containing protein n=1 Tax=Streptomyces sp. NPDC058623 TaxID=3346563 RepID=UPI003658EDA4